MTDVEEAGKSVDYCSRAMALMARFGIEPHPVHYEVWYTYAAGTNADLTRAIDNHLQKNSNGISSEVSETLWRQYCGRHATNQAIEMASEEMAGHIGRIVDYLERAAHESNAFGNALDGVTNSVEGETDPEALRAIVDRLVQATRRMEAKTRALESELETSVSEIKRLRDTLETTKKEATTDTLTGLANRAYFEEKLQRALRETIENKQQLSVILGDIDHFNAFNETWGHLTGDQVLRLVGGCLSENVKGRDIAARFGGEEFAVIFPQTGLKGARIVANHIRQTVERKKIVKKSTGETLGRITMSFGAVEYRTGERMSDLLQRAERTLRVAKMRGRNMTVGEDDLGKDADSPIAEAVKGAA
ncbi:MAG: GGDEF domain-containing protein [Alphaproteobacteria bacterium]|nr:GGDEF domain-containing protein [Alphaproteobacteria bacterium]MDX5370712.1 GGDEF domain-containing protein [Alphaproteobacteria bacterium]MDX5465129.1 GGDEF domain-containing protein [Alphaproteobacteria bacterium]